MRKIQIRTISVASPMDPLLCTKTEAMSLVCFHKKYVGITVEQHLYATSHGKDPCDGIAGTGKWPAEHASLQQITPL
jgi:hypothetical protein